MAAWNPETYLQFADERSRPFFDLLVRVHATDPHRVVDLGCGPGQLTATLADRWPTALIVGIDSSAEMIERARGLGRDRLSFSITDVRLWDRASAPRTREPLDVLLSNAALQWVPNHRDLFGGWVEALSPGGWFAFQVPANFDEPSHRLLRELAADSRFAEATREVEQPASFDAATYLADLMALGCRTDAWETTYLHVLTGPDPVFRWISGTAARPLLQALSTAQRAEFEAEYKALLHNAYPAQDFGTVLPFRRVFVVAQRYAARAELRP